MDTDDANAAWRRWDWLLLKAQSTTTLTEWEQNFLDDLLKKQDRQGINFRLTEKQEEILERIGEKG